jgi:hypothetical protein
MTDLLRSKRSASLWHSRVWVAVLQTQGFTFVEILSCTFFLSQLDGSLFGGK